MTSPTRTTSIGTQLLIFSGSRLVLNTAYRMIYPFLPVFARGLGVSLEALALGVTLRSIVGLAAPLVSTLPENRGKKIGALVGFGIFMIAMIVVPFKPIYLVFLASMVLVMLAKILIEPSIQGYVGDHVPFSKRGRAIAITEFGWAGAFLIGVPLVGLLMASYGWIAPFPILAIFGLGSAVGLWLLIPGDRPASVVRGIRWNLYRDLLRYRPALAALTLSFLISVANELIAIVFGSWLELSFGLQVAALGAASAVIGIAELLGEGLVAGISDRIGLRLAVALGLVASILTALSLPILGQTFAGALLGLFLLFLTFEYTVVNMIPLLTGLFTQGRATLLSVNFAAFSAGRAVGALLGPILFSVGLIGNGAAAAVLNLLALIILWRFIHVDATEESSERKVNAES